MGSTRAEGSRPEGAGTGPGSASAPSGPPPDSSSGPDRADDRPARRSILTLANQVWISALVAGYAVAFWFGIADLGAEAATFPRAVILVLIGFVLVGVVRDVGRWRQGEAEVVSDDDVAADTEATAGGAVAVWHKWHKTILTFALTAAFIWVIPRAGFYESATVFLAALFYVLGIRRPAVLVPLVAGVMLAAWLLFAVALNVRIPTGPLIG